MHLPPLTAHRSWTLCVLLTSLGFTLGCDEEKKPTVLSDRASSAGASSQSPCETQADCDDGIYCNGEEVCRDKVCLSGRPVRCDDEIECTLDRCDEEARAC